MLIRREFSDWTIVAGIDPGTRIVGAALIAVRGQELQLVDMRSWKISGATIEKRVDFVGASVEEWLPQGVKLTAVENGYVGKNPQSGLTIAMARGAVLRAVQRGGGEARLVDPSQARKSVGAARWGDRRKDAKARVQRAVALFLNLNREPTEDEADACVAGVWAANRVWDVGR